MQSNSSKKASKHPTKQSNSLKKAVPQRLKQLFEERRKAPPEDTAFINN